MNINSVAVHPLVLLSVVDHYKRVVKGNTSKRVVGVLLGELTKDKLDVSNSFAIPFDEENNDAGVWYIDHNFAEKMYSMFHKINAREKIVGWYATGSVFKQHDIQIHQVFKKYAENPVFVLIDVQHQNKLALPTECYLAKPYVSEQGHTKEKFQYISSSVEAYEPESIGVEHLLREIRDVDVGGLTQLVQQKFASLSGMVEKIAAINEYIQKVIKGEQKYNNQIVNNIQEILNLLPNLMNEKIIECFNTKNNDMMLVSYVCVLNRTILSLHTLINNKIQNQDKIQENKEEQKKVEDKKKEESEKKEKTDGKIDGKK